jgi:hypothetical protein
VRRVITTDPIHNSCKYLWTDRVALDGQVKAEHSHAKINTVANRDEHADAG